MSHARKGDDRSEEDEVVVHRSDGHDRAELSAGVLEALDSAPGYDVENSDTVVFDYIDLEALDDLFNAPDVESPRGRVTFAVDQYRVTATAAGEIIVRER